MGAQSDKMCCFSMRGNQYIATKGIHKIHVRQNAVAKSQYINWLCLNHVIMRVYGYWEQ